MGPELRSAWLWFSLLALACQDPLRESSREPTRVEPEPAPVEPDSDSEPAPEPEPGVDEPSFEDPGRPEVDPAELLDAPARYEHLLLRAALPVGRRYADLRYEGNNTNFRGPADAAGLFRSGDDTASDWRRYAAGVAGLVVLRDSLFSQQDHPTLQSPRALMLPPNWVSVAVAEVLAGRVPIAPRSGAIDDDAAWSGEAGIDAYFGSFPISERLFVDASRPLVGASASDQALTRNARTSMQMLGRAAEAMIAATPKGAERVAATGAAHIAASDRNYFGVELRRAVIIPIFVENPNEHEARDEGKGLGVWGRALPDEAIAITRRAVYARRLQDGALALERYDLRYEPERQRAIALLEELIPSGSSGPAIWLWVNAGSDGHGQGDPALPHIADFRRQLEAAAIETSRVVLLSKPSVRPWGDEAKAILEAETERYAKLAIPLSVQLSTAAFRKLIK